MATLEDSVIARMEVQEERFEVLVDPYLARDLREGKDVDLADLFAVDEVFKDVRKGERASREKIQNVFGTTDFNEVAVTIVKRGEIQLTTEQRREMVEQRKRQIITHISRNAVDPRTRTPHPPQRIELAMHEAKVHIDPFKDVDTQIKEVVNAIRPLLPLSMEKTTIAVKVQPEDVGRVYGDIRSFGEIVKEEWQKDGSWIGLVKIPAGLKDEFFERLNSKTRGRVETRIVR